MKDFFNFKLLKTSYFQELIGALSTFSAMVYIIVVHPTLLSEAGLPFGPIMTVTILITAFSTFLMGILGKVPLAVAPAMGIAAYFSFTLIQKNHMKVEQGLFVIFLSSLSILILNIFQIRKKILNKIPQELIIGITSGIGLFLVTVGLKQIGLIKLNHFGLIGFNGFDITTCLLTFLGLFLIAFFEKLNISGAFILTILLGWVISIFLGLTKVDQIVAIPPSFSSTFLLLEMPKELKFEFFKAFLSIFLVAIFDSSAGLLTLKRLLPSEAKNFDMQKALYPDAIGSTIGSLFGTTSLAIHLESMAGLHAGARSGFTSLIISGLFLVCLFFYPLASSIPIFASAPCVMAVGFLMAKELKQLIKMPLLKKIPMVLTAITMPLTMSLYQGFKVGFISLGILSLLFPQKVERSKTILIFAILFILEQLLVLLNFHSL